MQEKKGQKGNSKKIIILSLCFLLTVSALLVFKFFGPGFSEIEEFISSAYQEAQYSLGLINEYGRNDIAVHYLYVGQGDCEIVVCEGHAMLIDSGESGNENKIIDYLHKCGITTLEYVVATHPHSDHIGAMPYVLDSVNAKNLVMTGLPEELVPTYYCYNQLINIVSDSDINLIIARAGIRFFLGSAEVTILAPVDYGTDLNTDLNNNSIVLRIDYKGGSYIFQGDAELEEEESILNANLNIDCDVIKIGHHGGSSSSNEKYLKAVTPEIAVISCGKNNEYGHPHDKTLNRIKVYTDKIYRTDLLSYIVVTYDGKKYNVYFNNQ